MDITKFTEFKNGRLVPVDTGQGRNWAFIPNPLPGSFQMSPKLFALLPEATLEVGRMEQIKGVLPHPMLLLQPLQQREALRSSALEGTHTLPEELLLFDMEQGNDSSVRASKGGSAELEVWNYYKALREGHNALQAGGEIDESLMRSLHSILMSGVRGRDRRPGQLRQSLVAVGRRPRRFIPPPPDEVPRCLSALFSFIREDESFNPLVKAFLVHYQFEAIHPFEDGNGRVGRMLLSLCVSRWMRQSLPWLYMSEFYDNNRQEYTERLLNISTNGEWEEWIEFCLQGTIEQARESVIRCESLKSIRDRYMGEFAPISRHVPRIIDMLFQRPLLRIKEVAEECSCSEETARQQIKKLLGVGMLEELKGRRPKVFACPEIIRVAYQDTTMARVPNAYAGEP